MPTGHAAARVNRANPLVEWLSALGLWGKGSKDKFVPAPVFTLPRPQLALFLNRVFTTDGWATVLGDGQARVGYSTVSERLARQVQHLLLRFGVIARLRERHVKYRGTRRPSWQLDVTDRASVRTFVAEIGIFGKEAAVGAVGERARSKSGRPNADRIPAEVWNDLAAAKGSESWASVADRAGLGADCNLRVGKRSLSRDGWRRWRTPSVQPPSGNWPTATCSGTRSSPSTRPARSRCTT